MKSNTIKYGRGASSSNVVTEFAFSPPNPKKKISDDATTFLRIGLQQRQVDGSRCFILHIELTF